MRLFYPACAFVACIALVVIAASIFRDATPPGHLQSVAHYATAIVDTLAETDPAFRDRLIDRLEVGVK